MHPTLSIRTSRAVSYASVLSIARPVTYSAMSTSRASGSGRWADVWSVIRSGSDALAPLLLPLPVLWRGSQRAVARGRLVSPARVPLPQRHERPRLRPDVLGGRAD